MWGRTNDTEKIWQVHKNESKEKLQSSLFLLPSFIFPHEVTSISGKGRHDTNDAYQCGAAAIFPVLSATRANAKEVWWIIQGPRQSVNALNLRGFKRKLNSFTRRSPRSPLESQFPFEGATLTRERAALRCLCSMHLVCTVTQLGRRSIPLSLPGI